MGTRYFTPKLFAFLRDLAENNDRDWFRAHQDDYEEQVRQPSLAFIADVADPLQQVSPYFVADPAKTGGSLYRIQRDARFAGGRPPYRVNTGMQFRHVRAKDVAAPTFFVSLQPGHCFMGAGIWRPETRLAYEIRAAIADDPAAWRQAVGSKRFAAVYTLVGDSLIRAPKGYADDHPLLEDLRRKDFAASTALTHKQVTSPDLLETFLDNCRRASPFMEFLCGVVGVPF